MSIEIIEFEDKWAADFAALNYEWIERYFTVERHDREILDNPRQYVLDPGGEIFMAVADGVAAGTVAMIPAGNGVVELTKMAVSPGFHRLGIADMLMDRCILFAREAGYATIFLETHSSLAPAVALYLKHGFVQTPTDPNSEYARADVRMELALADTNL
ncbi:MAG: GNAT family N-acetyltransferase [Chloracidobacterium sp.]|nr:GNAT family N-acetyltransferase [Chloracidobacterium sp.]